MNTVIFSGNAPSTRFIKTGTLKVAKTRREKTRTDLYNQQGKDDKEEERN